MSGGFIVAHHASCAAPFPARPRPKRRLGDAQPVPLGRVRRPRTLSIFLGMWFSATYTMPSNRFTIDDSVVEDAFAPGYRY